MPRSLRNQASFYTQAYIIEYEVLKMAGESSGKLYFLDFSNLFSLFCIDDF